MPVGTTAFIGDPEGAQIALFEDMQVQPVLFRRSPGCGMDRTDIAIKHDIGHAFPGDDFCQMVGPILGRIAVQDQPVLRTPEKGVTCIEGDAPDGRPGCAKKSAQVIEERPVGALQQQEDARLWWRTTPSRGVFG